MQYRKNGLTMSMLCLAVTVLVGSFVLAPPVQAANDRPLIYGQNPIETDIYWGYDKNTNDPIEFDRMSSSGCTSCRIGVNWPVIEATRGTYDWSDIDRLVKLAIDRNINPVLLINGTPTWALPTVNPDIPVPEARYPCSMTYITDYNNFITALANRYKGRVQFYEYWNEANGYGWHWDGGYSRADEYTPWMIRAYDLLKAADPNCKMSTSGFDDNGGYGDYMLQLIYNYGGQGHFDAVADHPYSSGTLDDYKLTDIRNLLNTNGDTGVDIWITEMGWTSAGRESTVAGWITDYFNRLVNTHTTVKIATYHTAMDFDTSARYGLIDQYFNTRSTWTAFSNYSKPARPTITNISVTNLTATSCTVNYTTNVVTKGIVMYGTANTYGSVTTKETTAVTSHAINLSSLSASTTYHYRIRVSDPTYGVYGDSYSADATFTTSAAATGTIGGWVKDTNNAAISGATVSTNTGGYTTTTAADGTYTLSNVTVGTYNVTASKSGYNAATNNNVSVTQGNTTTSNFNLTAFSGYTENLETMPSWTSTYDAPWGTPAVWSNPSGGVSGNYMQATRPSEHGSSVKVKVYTVPADTNLTLSVYMKCPSYGGGSYWNELSYKLGSYSAQDNDDNHTTWTVVKRFENSGTNGNGNVWTQYTTTVNTGANTQISMAFKNGALYCVGPTVGWDTMQISYGSCTNPSITAQPQNSTVCAGTTASFSVTATGASSYQWRKASTNISGATNSSYSIASAATGDAGSYDCVVSNTCGTVTSNAATLTVNSAPSITTHPQNSTVCAGTGASFSVTATGATSYQWKKGGSNISGATNSSYSIASTVTGDAGSYTVAVTNSCSTITSNAATLTVNAVPSITTQPQSQTKSVGQSVTFSVTATGATGYQWKKGGSNISGATASAYTIASVVTGDAGSFTCAVSNTCGTVTSNAATLTVSTGIASEAFESMPTWSTTFDATWGSAASFGVVSGGQSGNYMQAYRSTNGSSVKAKVYTVPSSTNITMSVYIKCPSYGGGGYWVETGYRLGSNTAQDFDANPANWTQIQKFSDTGTNGNGNVWTQYTATVNTGGNTQITIGYKHGAYLCVGPTMGWDTFSIQ